MRLILLLFIVLTACSGSIFKTMQSLPSFPSSQDISDSLNATVLIFIDLDCPISQYAVKPLNTIKTESNGQVEVIGVIPGGYYSNKELQSFITKFDVQFSIIKDSNLDLVKRLNAHITPEAFLLDKDERVYYQGAVDDKFLELGKSKPLPNKSFLNEAIIEFLAGKNISNPKTDAIGCIIER